METYPDLAALIQALSRKHHDGAIYPMAAKIGVSVGTVQQWANGMIKRPGIPTLRLLSRAYGLDLDDLIDLVYKPSRKPWPIRGGSGASQILPVEPPSVGADEVIPAVPSKSLKRRPSRDIMSTKHLWPYLRLVTHLHSDHYVGSEARLLRAA